MKNAKQGRDISIGTEAKDNLLKALDFISQAVGSTMGPGGRPFGFDKLGTDMRLTASFSKDGLTVLKSLGFDDPAWQAVLQYCKQASGHSVLASGDGTTSTIILANAVAKAVSEAGGRSPQAIAREIEEDADRAIECIRKEAKVGDRHVRSVALTSTNGDEELTDVVLESIKNSGAFGSVLVEKNPAMTTRYKVVRQDGYSNTTGYNYNQMMAISASPDAAGQKPILWSNPQVICFNGSLIVNTQVEPILNAWNERLKTGSIGNLVIVAYEASEEVCHKLLVLNRTIAKHGVAAFIVRPRLTAEVNSGVQVMTDIASFCGIDDKKIIDGGNYKDVDGTFFGTCDKIKISPMQTVYLGRAANHWVDKRIDQNKSIIEESRSQFDKDVTTIRNAELAEGLVKVEVGGGLLPDLQERADRFDDAAKAAQSCMRSGALPGGGISYIRAAQLAKVNASLQTALSSILLTVLDNYGSEMVIAVYPTGDDGYKLTRKGVVFGNAEELGVLDACETVAAVIKNGTALGVKIATLGGYSFRDLQQEITGME